MGKGAKGNLMLRCRDCHRLPKPACCEPEFMRCTVLDEHQEKLAREIIEANEITKNHDHCVSTPSVLLTWKELALLNAS